MRGEVIKENCVTKKVLNYLSTNPKEPYAYKILRETQLSTMTLYCALKILLSKNIIRFSKPPQRYRGQIKLSKLKRIKGYYYLTEKGKRLYKLIVEIEKLWDEEILSPLKDYTKDL